MYLTLLEQKADFEPINIEFTKINKKPDGVNLLEHSHDIVIRLSAAKQK